MKKQSLLTNPALTLAIGIIYFFATLFAIKKVTTLQDFGLAFNLYSLSGIVSLLLAKLAIFKQNDHEENTRLANIFLPAFLLAAIFAAAESEFKMFSLSLNALYALMMISLIISSFGAWALSKEKPFKLDFTLKLKQLGMLLGILLKTLSSEITRLGITLPEFPGSGRYK